MASLGSPLPRDFTALVLFVMASVVVRRGVRVSQPRSTSCVTRRADDEGAWTHCLLAEVRARWHAQLPEQRLIDLHTQLLMSVSIWV
jgi:hypothetical protein